MRNLYIVFVIGQQTLGLYRKALSQYNYAEKQNRNVIFLRQLNFESPWNSN